MRRPPTRAFLLGLAVGLVVALVRRSRRTATPPPGPPTLDRARPSLAAPSAAAPPRATVELDATHAPVQGASMAPAPTIDLEPPSVDGPAWAAPVEGACPDGYPVKAKEASGIFHVPGGLSYERTRPDRCYATPQAATADGFRPAKR